MFLRLRVSPLLAKLQPRVAATLMWIISPGSLLFIRYFFEGGMYLPYWAVRLGDTVGFPLFAATSTSLVQKFGLGKKAWLYRWPIGVLFVIYVLASIAGYLNWRNGVNSGTLPKRMQDAPSEKLHTWGIFGVITLLILQMIGAVLGSKASKRQKAIALSPLLLFILGGILDRIFPTKS